MKNIVNLISIVLIFNVVLFSQQSGNTNEPQKNPPPQTTEPVDLPTIFVKGQLLLNVNSGSKQDPEKPMRLTMEQLDSLNSLEKQQSLPIQIEPIPLAQSRVSVHKGYMNLDIGRFAMGTLNGGYSFNTEGYELFAKAGMDYSAGHVENSDYTKMYAKLSSDYIAPQKFFIFGGSRTKTQIEYRNSNYQLYAVSNPAERTTHNFNADVDVDGNYSGLRFQTGLGFEAFQSITEANKAANNNIAGYLKIHKLWNSFMLAGNVLADMNYLRGNAANFIQLDGSAEWIVDNLSLNLNAGFQLAGSSTGIDRGGLLLSGNLEYRIDKRFTFKSALQSGLENKNWTDYFKENPYLANNSNLDFAYNIALAQAFLYYHPNNDMGLSIGGKFRITDRNPFYTNSSKMDGSFALNYESAVISNAVIELFWNLTENSKILSNFQIISSSLSDKNSKNVPYMPNIKFAVDYSTKIVENFGTTFGIDFVGERFADIENQKTIDSYLNIRAKIDYSLSNYFMVYASFDNLINQEVMIFDGYKERGMFVNIGLMLQF